MIRFKPCGGKLSVGQCGFSLLEMLIVVVLMSILMPAMLSAFTFSAITIRETRMLETAKHISQSVMEGALSDRFPDPVQDEPFDASMPGYRYSLAFSYEAATGRTYITVTVRYQVIAQPREYTTVAIRYAIQ